MWCPGPRNRVQSLPSTDETTLSLVNGHGRFCRERACPRSCARRKLLTIWERHGLGLYQIVDRRGGRQGSRRRFTVSSDAHSTLDYANIWPGVGSARRGWLGPDDVLKTRSLENIRPLLNNAAECCRADGGRSRRRLLCVPGPRSRIRVRLVDCQWWACPASALVSALGRDHKFSAGAVRGDTLAMWGSWTRAIHATWRTLTVLR
jgi:hypothetical protein